MKLKTAVISVVVSAALVGGAGYGAYYAMNGQKKPVQVVPVANINNSYWGDGGDSIYGSITSQVAQIVNLNEEYSIDEIFVEEGDQVKEGDPLFSYDMTLPELELEMEQLTLQTKELTLTKLEKDLEKYKRGDVDDNASLDDMDDSYSTSGDVEPVSEDPSGAAEAQSPNGQSSETAGQEDAGGDDLIEEPLDGGTDGQTDSQPAQGGLQVEGVEVVPESEEEGFTIIDSVVSYEQLVAAIDALFTAYGDDLKPEEVGSAIDDAVAYFRKNLANERVTTVADDNGEAKEHREYEIRDEVRSALGEEDTSKFQEYIKKLDAYQVRYVEMLIQDADARKETLGRDAFQEALSTIKEEYDLLATSLQEKVGNLSVLQELEAYEPGVVASDDEFLEDAQDVNELEAGETENESGEETNAEEETGESESESETEQAYTVTCRLPGGEKTEAFKPGDTVKLTAPTADLMMIFQGWTLETSGGDPAEIEGADLSSETIEFIMPPYDVVAVPAYKPNGDRIDKYVGNFLNMAEDITSENAVKESEYFNMFENAIKFYQSWLAIPDGATPEEVMDGTAIGTMESYTLKQIITDYLKEKAGDAAENESENETQEGEDQPNGGSDRVTVELLQKTYEKLCKDYVLVLYKSVNSNPSNIDKEVLDRALAAYGNLGDNWKKALETQWKADAENTAGRGIEDSLKAFVVLQKFQDYQARKDSISEEARKALLQELLTAYNGLTDAQKAIVSSDQEFVNDVLNAAAIPSEPETEPSTEMPVQDPEDPGDFDDGGWDDGWDDGDFDGGYTASELREMIEAKEREIKECKLDIRESELTVSQKQRIVDGKIVKSTMDGTVISIGNPDGESDNDYFAKIANEAGLYAQGAMNELALEQIKVGDTISGMQTDTGVSFTAVIKEISEYPDPNGGNMYYGSGNSNASYYPFYAKLDNTDDIEEGEAEIQLSESMSNDFDTIYLDKSFVRTGNDGKSYVYKQGEDGTLTKQYVTTGKVIYSFAVEIVSGLTLEDKIAFPYGKNVVEGAPTKEVDMLEYV